MKKLVGEKEIFAVEYMFDENSHSTELSMFVGGVNILEYVRENKVLTACWDFDELAQWLRSFLDNLSNDPYPAIVEGEFAAQKDDAARKFDSDDDNEFEEYYNKLYVWNQKHRWHSVSSGAILADVFFQQVDEYVEVSWDNRGLDNDVKFSSEMGGCRVPKKVFVEVTNEFLNDYADYWFG